MDWFANGWLIHKVEEADDAIPVCYRIADFCEVALVDVLPVKVLVLKEGVVHAWVCMNWSNMTTSFCRQFVASHTLPA